DGGELRLALDADDEVVRVLARRAAGTVGDGDERWLERLQPDDVGEEFVPRGVGLRREELEAERPRMRGKDVANMHGSYRSRIALRLRVRPRRAVRAAEELVRLVVADDLLLRCVPGQTATELHRLVRQDATRRRDVALLDVGDRLATRGNRLQ